MLLITGVQTPTLEFQPFSTFKGDGSSNRIPAAAVAAAQKVNDGQQQATMLLQAAPPTFTASSFLPAQPAQHQHHVSRMAA